MAEAIVIGSGPAGVAAAWPLLRAGHAVTIVDAGERPVEQPETGRPPLAAMRQAASPQWDRLLGRDRRALVARDGVSPKLRTAAPADFTDGWAETNGIETHGFRAVGALSSGGLSSVWGAAAIAYTDADLAGWPIRAADLAPSYRSVAARIGISGSAVDELAGEHGADLPLQPPLPIGLLAQKLLDAWRAGSARRTGTSRVVLGQARNAVLTRDLGGRRACALDNACMWGCTHGSVYASHQEHAALKRAGARFITGLAVQQLKRRDALWQVHGLDAGGREVTLEAGTVVLAAGALPSTRLALDALERFDSPVPVLNTPACAFALISPTRIGARLPERQFGMAHLAFTTVLGTETARRGYGTLFAADGVSAADLAEAMFLTRRGAAAVTRLLLPALTIGIHYLPSEFSTSSAVLRGGSGGRSRLVVQGAVRGDARALHREGLRLLSRSLGTTAWVLPPSVRSFEPGAEAHVGGSLPMGGPVGVDGELAGAPGLFLADAATFPSIPAKHHTFTVMANADRIGKGIASRLQGGG
jgi:choline dehydrogenase-like flavoprotein